MNRYVLMGLIVAVGMLIASSHLVLRHAMKDIALQETGLFSWRTLRSAISSPYVWMSLLAGLLTFTLYACVLSRAPVTLAAPTVAAVAYLIIFVVSAVWGEKVTPSRIAGAALLPLSVWLLSKGGS